MMTYLVYYTVDNCKLIFENPVEAKNEKEAISIIIQRNKNSIVHIKDVQVY